MRDKKRVNVRKPDLGVVLNSNPVPLKLNGNRYDGIFDLCIEALSDTTKKAKERDTVEKKEEYEYVRVKEYFILDGKAIESAFYRLNRWGIYEEIKPIDGNVIRSEVLPGFQFRTSDLYQLTPLKELVKDEVYRGFVMLDYQQSEQEKEQALLRAEQAEQQKEQQKLRAEQAEQEKEQQKRRAEQERKEKEEALRLAEEERKQKEEALKRAEEAEKEKERMAAILKQLGISLD
jgi:flagellar biosynthesis GTPase FlhF